MKTTVEQRCNGRRNWGAPRPPCVLQRTIHSAIQQNTTGHATDHPPRKVDGWGDRQQAEMKDRVRNPGVESLSDRRNLYRIVRQQVLDATPIMATPESYAKGLIASKLLLAIGLVIGSTYLGEWIGKFAAANFTDLSQGLSQAITASQFFPMFLGIALVARYSAQLLTTVPLTEGEKTYRFEKSAIRGVFSILVLLGGSAWWAWNIFTVEMLFHTIFTWATPFVVVGVWLTSWYHSKREMYRSAQVNVEQFKHRDPSDRLPNIAELLGGLIRGEVKLKEIGLKRGLPVLMFRIKPENEPAYKLNLGFDRLLPTIVATQRQPKQLREGGEQRELQNLRRSLKDEIEQLSEEMLQSMDYQKTQKIQTIAPNTTYERNITRIESLSKEETRAIKEYYRRLSDFEEYIVAYSQRKGGGNIQNHAEPLIEAKENAIRILDQNLEDHAG